MRFGKYAEAFSRTCGSSLVCDERRDYEASEHRAREDATNTVRAESEKLAAERDAREREKQLGAGVRFEMASGLLPAQVDREIAHGRRAGDVGHRVVAFYLADCADRGLYQAFGHPSVIPYAVKRHGISRRRARDLIAAGRALRELLKIDREFIAGDLFWSQVRELVKVADVDTEDEWIAFAKSHSIEQLEGEVRRAKKGERPREDRKGLPEVKFNLSLRVNALVFEQYDGDPRCCPDVFRGLRSLSPPHGRRRALDHVPLAVEREDAESYIRRNGPRCDVEDEQGRS